ncbi:MAG: tRNA (adenine(22)-N(1))-methyltransferase [Bacilli bacterium]
MNINLSNRLETIKRFVPPQCIPADVGADHGYLICSLLIDNIVELGYAVENKKGPFTHLCETIKLYSLENKVYPLFSSGIRDLPDNVNTLILAGMGSESIIEILNARKDFLSHIDMIICDSHTNLFYLRSEMQKLGFYVKNEEIIQEKNIYYEIVVFIKDSTLNYSLTELKYGPILLKNKSKVYIKKYNEYLTKLESILNKNISSNRKEDILKEIKEIKEVIFQSL